MGNRGPSVVFVGNLPGDVREREIDDLFAKYGRIRSVDLKVPPRPPAFAFVEFESVRDAEDAVRGRDGYDFFGSRIRVEIAKGGLSGRAAPGPPPPNYRTKGSAYRVLVKNLPTSASWQDLKDHFRKVCTPNYVNVYRDRGGVMGVVEFDTPEDLDRAVRKLDDTEFRNPFERTYVRVIDDSDTSRAGGRGGSRRHSPSRSRSRSRSRRRSPSSSRSRSRSRSRRRSASKSLSKSRSKSRSRSRSRSKSRSKSKSKSRSKSKSKSRSASKSPFPQPLELRKDEPMEAEAANGADEQAAA